MSDTRDHSTSNDARPPFAYDPEHVTDPDTCEKKFDMNRAALNAFTRGDRKRLAELAHQAGMAPAALEEICRLATGDLSQARAVVRRMDSVVPRAVQWLWPQRIARGKVTLLVGDPGLGKSFLTLDIAARVSTASHWPDAGQQDPDRINQPTSRGGVVLLSAEDALDDTIRPRLDAAGADCHYIASLTGVRVRQEDQSTVINFDVSRDMDALQEALCSVINPSLVIIDPLTAYMGATDSHKNAEVRATLSGLSQIAEAWNVAVLAVSHLNKATGTSAIYRAMGSLAFTAAARAVHTVVKDPHNPQRRLFLPVKNNIGNDRNGLAYELRDDTSLNLQPQVHWSADPVTVSADEALSPPQHKPGKDADALNDAITFLQDALKDGPRPTVEVHEEGKEVYGLSSKALQRARKELGVRAERNESTGPWYISLPANPSAAA